MRATLTRSSSLNFGADGCLVSWAPPGPTKADGVVDDGEAAEEDKVDGVAADAKKVEAAEREIDGVLKPEAAAARGDEALGVSSTRTRCEEIDT